MAYAFPGFISGFLATITFHQLALLVLWASGLAPARPFALVPTQPFGVPAVLSLALWGGLWGILLAVLHRAFPRGWCYWLMAFLFGAILPSLVALLVVFPLKGRPMGGGWHPSLLLTAFIINGAWGIGTAAFLSLFGRWMKTPGNLQADGRAST